MPWPRAVLNTDFLSDSLEIVLTFVILSLDSHCERSWGDLCELEGKKWIQYKEQKHIRPFSEEEKHLLVESHINSPPIKHRNGGGG